MRYIISMQWCGFPYCSTLFNNKIIHLFFLWIIMSQMLGGGENGTTYTICHMLLFTVWILTRKLILLYFALFFWKTNTNYLYGKIVVIKEVKFVFLWLFWVDFYCQFPLGVTQSFLFSVDVWACMIVRGLGKLTHFIN